MTTIHARQIQFAKMQNSSQKYKRKKLIPCKKGAEVEQRLEYLAYKVTRKNEVEALV